MQAQMARRQFVVVIAALVMTALVGFDPLDPVSIRAEREDLRAAIGRDVRALRIGIPRSPFFEGLDPEVEAATNRALEVLTSPQQALAEGAAVIRDEKEGQADNHIYDWEAGDKEATDKAFAPVIIVSRGRNVLVVRSSSPFKAVNDVVTAAKAAPGPMPR